MDERCTLSAPAGEEIFASAAFRSLYPRLCGAPTVRVNMVPQRQCLKQRMCAFLYGNRGTASQAQSVLGVISKWSSSYGRKHPESTGRIDFMHIMNEWAIKGLAEKAQGGELHDRDFRREPLPRTAALWHRAASSNSTACAVELKQQDDPLPKSGKSHARRHSGTLLAESAVVQAGLKARTWK